MLLGYGMKQAIIRDRYDEAMELSLFSAGKIGYVGLSQLYFPLVKSVQQEIPVRLITGVVFNDNIVKAIWWGMWNWKGNSIFEHPTEDDIRIAAAWEQRMEFAKYAKQYGAIYAKMMASMPAFRKSLFKFLTEKKTRYYSPFFAYYDKFVHDNSDLLQTKEGETIFSLTAMLTLMNAIPHEEKLWQIMRDFWTGYMEEAERINMQPLQVERVVAPSKTTIYIELMAAMLANPRREFSIEALPKMVGDAVIDYQWKVLLDKQPDPLIYQDLEELPPLRDSYSINLSISSYLTQETKETLLDVSPILLSMAVNVGTDLLEKDKDIKERFEDREYVKMGIIGAYKNVDDLYYKFNITPHVSVNYGRLLVDPRIMPDNGCMSVYFRKKGLQLLEKDGILPSGLSERGNDRPQYYSSDEVIDIVKEMADYDFLANIIIKGGENINAMGI